MNPARVFDTCLEMRSDSKQCFAFVVDVFSWRSVQNADCRLQTADRVQNADLVQNADCRLQTGYKMQTEFKMQTDKKNCFFASETR